MRLQALALLALLGACLFPGKGDESNADSYSDPEKDLGWVARSMLRITTNRYVAASERVTAYQLRADMFVAASRNERRFIVRRCVWTESTNRCELTDVRDGVAPFRLHTPEDFGAITDQQMPAAANEVREVLEDMNATALAPRDSDNVALAPKRTLKMWADKGRAYVVALDAENLLTIDFVDGTNTRRLGRVSYPGGTLRLLAVYGSFRRPHLGAIALEHEELRPSGIVAYHSWVIFKNTTPSPAVWVIPGAAEHAPLGRNLDAPPPKAPAGCSPDDCRDREHEHEHDRPDRR